MPWSKRRPNLTQARVGFAGHFPSGLDLGSQIREAGRAFRVEERGYEGDLKLDLLPAQRGRRGQGRELIKRPVKLRRSFHHCRTRHGTLPRLAPKARSLLGQPGICAVARQNLRLVLSDVREVPFEGFGNASVQRTSRLAQKGAVGRILDQRVLKEITRMRRYALTKQQASPNDPIQATHL